MTAIQSPHFAFPFERLPNGKVKMVEQGTADHVMSCEAFIAATPLGIRPERPEFGWKFPTFQLYPLDLTPLTLAMQTWEPRGKAQADQYLEIVAGTGAISNVEVDVSVQEDTNGN